MTNSIVGSKSAGFLIEEYDDGTLIIVCEESGTAHVLNHTAALVYNLCTKGGEINSLEQAFIDSFNTSNSNISTSEMSADFRTIIDDLLNKGLIFSEMNNN